MTRIRRIVICSTIVFGGLGTQAALEGVTQPIRPSLRRPLTGLPLEIGDWIGVDQPVTEQLLQKAQSTEYLSRIYESRKWPGVSLRLWVNYSIMGNNLRHSPTVCLPGAGWKEEEAQKRIYELESGGEAPIRVSRLGFSQADMVEHVGFWYYIFGEGKLENYVRNLPITSQTSHGRATRGSSMTIEVFYPGNSDPNGVAFREFARDLLLAMEPILPQPRASYHLP
jgi:EpsI family protein